jgi:hypothetical protein
MTLHYGGKKENKRIRIVSTILLTCIKDITDKQVDEVITF